MQNGKNGRLFVFATPATFFIITNTIIFIVMYSIVVFGFVQKLKKGILQTGHTQTMWTSMGGEGVSEMSTLLIKPI